MSLWRKDVWQLFPTEVREREKPASFLGRTEFGSTFFSKHAQQAAPLKKPCFALKHFRYHLCHRSNITIFSVQLVTCIFHQLSFSKKNLYVPITIKPNLHTTIIRWINKSEKKETFLLENTYPLEEMEQKNMNAHPREAIRNRKRCAFPRFDGFICCFNENKLYLPLADKFSLFQLI